MVLLCPIQGDASVAERGMHRLYRKAASNSTTIPTAPRSTRLSAYPHAAMTASSLHAKISPLITSDARDISSFPVCYRRSWGRGIPLPQTPPPQQPRNQKSRTSVSWGAGRTPKPDAVGAKAWVVVAAVGHTEDVPMVAPTAPAQDPVRSTCRPQWITSWRHTV